MDPDIPQIMILQQLDKAYYNAFWRKTCGWASYN